MFCCWFRRTRSGIFSSVIYGLYATPLFGFFIVDDYHCWFLSCFHSLCFKRHPSAFHKLLLDLPFRFVLPFQLITEWLITLSFSLFDASFFQLDLSFVGLECYGFQKVCFILRYFLPFISSNNWCMHHHNPILSRLTWQPTVQPRRQHGFMMMFKTQSYHNCFLGLHSSPQTWCSVMSSM